LPDRSDHPGAGGETEPAGGSLRVALVVKEPVDRRPGAAYVRPEGAVLEQLAGDGRPARGQSEVVCGEGGEVARASDGGERLVERGAALLVPLGTAGLVKASVDVSGRVLPRAARECHDDP